MAGNGVSPHARARARFQSGLLAWLRRPDEPSGLREMVAVIRSLEGTSQLATEQVLWRSAESFLTSLMDGSALADDEARRLCRRIERHLATATQGDPGNGSALCAALFAYVSRRSHGPAGESSDIVCMARQVDGLSQLGATLSVTAELLPLFAGARTARYTDAQVDRWRAAARHVDDLWHRVHREGSDPCRQAATALLAVALELHDQACLRLAESLAHGVGCADDPAFRDDPALRAAMAAGLELACEREGPNLAAFDRRSRIVATRIATAESQLRVAAESHRKRDRTQRFVDAARAQLVDLRAALEHTPSDPDALAAAFGWLARDHGVGNVLAIRGLAVLAEQTLAACANHTAPADPRGALGLVLSALECALDDLEFGRPPRPDEPAFAALRSLAPATTARAAPPPLR